MKKAFLAGLVAVFFSGSAMAASSAEYGLLAPVIPLFYADLTQENGDNGGVEALILGNHAWSNAKLIVHMNDVVKTWNKTWNKQASSPDALMFINVHDIDFKDEVGATEDVPSSPIYYADVWVEITDCVSWYRGCQLHYDNHHVFHMVYRYGVWELAWVEQGPPAWVGQGD